MVKARIIIADTDVNYMLSLQLKFVEEFYEKVDLEIITDPDYFGELFSMPQKAELLIVSEDLYDLSLQRHNIGTMFLMTEQYQEETTADLNVYKIFKYTSIKEIFNEIIGKSPDVLTGITLTKKEPQILLVYSASGGVGKTTVALGMSVCLTQNYKKVLYINAARLQTFQRFLDNPAPITDNEVYTKLTNPSKTIYEDIKYVIRKEIFYYLPPWKATLMSLGISYSVFETIIMAAKQSNEYDFIVIDADSVFDHEKARLIHIADKVIVVTKQDSTSVFATNQLLANINGLNGEKYFFVCNDFMQEEENALIASNLVRKFTVSEYIEHMNHYDSIPCADLARSKGIQKMAFIVL